MKKLIFITILIIAAFASDSCDLPSASKVDCGYSGMNPNDCTAKGCCWVPVSSEEYFKRMLRG